jgi:hypothetical protein
LNAVLLGMAISASAVTVAAAQTVAVPNGATCPRCTVVAETLFTLGTTDQDMLASSQLARDSRGRFFGTAAGGRSVVVWDSAGKYLRTFGGPGQGPGEMSQPISRVLIGRGDSILVAERGLLVSVFSPTLAFARRIRLHARPNSLAILPNGQLLMSTDVQSSAGIGHPFYLLDGATGTVVRSFGLEGILITPGQTVSISRQPAFTPSADGASLWSRSIVNGYRLERWGTDGTRRETLDMSGTPWYRPYAELADTRTAEERRAESLARLTPRGFDSLQRVIAARTPPRSSLSVAGVARNGEIWMLTTEPVAPSADPKSVKCWLEIIDPATRTKVVSTRVPGFFTMMPGTDLTYSSSVDANTGIITLAVSRVRIQGR